MGTVSEKLNYLIETKEQIKEALINKGVNVNDTDTFRSYATKIGEIQSGASDIKITDASYLFYKNARIDYLNELLSMCETVSSVQYMFSDCSKLTEVDVSKLDISNVTSTRQMFYSCSKLTELDVSNFDTSNVTTMSSMFYYCKTLTDLDLSNFDMSKVKVISLMMDNLMALTNLRSFKNLGKGYTSKSTNYSDYKLDLSRSTLLTYESLMDVINNLYDLNLTYDVANGGTLATQSLILGSTNLAKLTAEEIAIATNKGWNVS